MIQAFIKMGTGVSRQRSSIFTRSVVKEVPNFKFVLLGEPSVGKTSIFRRYSKNSFDLKYMPTTEPSVDTVVKQVNVPDHVIASVTLWDLPGVEDMDLRDSYYRNADAAIVVVDMNTEKSIELAGSWRQEFVSRVTKAGYQPKMGQLEKLPLNVKSVPVLLLGNKYDLIEELEDAAKLKDDLQVPLTFDLDSNDLSRDVEQQDSPGNGEGTVENVSGSKQENQSKKPECVQLLEKMEEKSGFVSSVMVSAKDGDDSVHAAIQSLVRYLLARALNGDTKFHKPPQKKKAQPSRKSKREKSEWVTYSGLEEVDAIFRHCAVPLKRSDELVSYHALMLKHFKQTCADKDLLQESKASLEDCIIGIKDALKKEQLQLKMRGDQSFVELYYDEDSSKALALEAGRAVQTFNKEYGSVCKLVLRDVPTLRSMLRKLDNHIGIRSEAIPHSFVNSYSGQEKKQLMDICDKNRAAIAYRCDQLAECLKFVQNVVAKIKDSILW